jgi:hypothetical protein
MVNSITGEPKNNKNNKVVFKATTTTLEIKNKGSTLVKNRLAGKVLIQRKKRMNKLATARFTSHWKVLK